jgi:hypothetical protein
MNKKDNRAGHQIPGTTPPFAIGDRIKLFVYGHRQPYWVLVGNIFLSFLATDN